MDYRHPTFFKHLPSFQLYRCMMGIDSIYKIGHDFILYTQDSTKFLPCGCLDQKAVRIVKDDTILIYEPLSHEQSLQIELNAQERISFQSKNCIEFWENYFRQNPHHRPITVNNKL